MNVFIGVALLFHILDDLLVTPDRPVMTGEINFSLSAKRFQSLVDKATPCQRVPHLRASGCIDIMQVTRHYFGAAERINRGQEKSQLRRRF